MATGVIEQLKEYAGCYGGNGNCKECFGDWNCGSSCHDNAKMLLHDLDIAEVVRCKDCKFRHYEICDHYIMAHDKVNEDDFCSYGERK